MDRPEILDNFKNSTSLLNISLTIILFFTISQHITSRANPKGRAA